LADYEHYASKLIQIDGPAHLIENIRMQIKR